MNGDDIVRLADAYADGTIDDAGLDRLEHALATDAAARRQYLAIMRWHQQVRTALRSPVVPPTPDRPITGGGHGWTIGLILGVVATSIIVGVVATRPVAAVLTRVTGGVTVVEGGVSRPALSGMAVAVGSRIEAMAGASATIRQGGSSLDLGPSTVVRHDANAWILDDGEAVTQGAMTLGLGGDLLHVTARTRAMAAPWAVLVQSAGPWQVAGTSLPDGGQARRSLKPSAWRVEPSEPTVLVGTMRLAASTRDHYLRTQRFLVEDAQVGAEIWTPDATAFLARLRWLGGDVTGMRVDGDALVLPAAGPTGSHCRLPIGALAGGVAWRLRQDFRSVARAGTISRFGFDLGLKDAEIMPDGPRSRCLGSGAPMDKPMLVQDLEWRILPVGEQDGQPVFEVALWVDGGLHLVGWSVGQPVFTIHFNDATMRLSRMRAADLVAPLPPLPPLPAVPTP